MSIKKNSLKEEAIRLGRQAKVAARQLAPLSSEEKNHALLLMADRLEAKSAFLLEENRKDLEAARSAAVSAALLDRIALSPSRVQSMAKALRDIAALPDPVHEIIKMWRRPNGLQVGRMRIPLGVIGIIYEARPNVTADAAGLCLKSGNAVILRGGSSAARSNAAIVSVLRRAVPSVGLPEDAIQLLDSSSRDSVKELMRARGLVDVLIPRGGAALIRSVGEESTVPVIETGVGNCHVYVDAAADLDMALAILLNAKTSRPSVCNAAEPLLVHRDVAERFLARALPALREAGVTVHGSPEVVAAGTV